MKPVRERSGGGQHRACPFVDDDASPAVLETMEAAANIHMDDTITPGVGLSSNTFTCS